MRAIRLVATAIYPPPIDIENLMNATSSTVSTAKRSEARLNFFMYGPDAMSAMDALEQRIRQSDLDKALVELVRIRVSQINGCAYCIDKHTSDARNLKVEERRLTLLPVWRESHLFSDKERAALAWAEALTNISSGGPSDAIWDQASECFLPSQLVDLTLVITTINAWNRFAIGFRKLPV